MEMGFSWSARRSQPRHVQAKPLLPLRSEKELNPREVWPESLAAAQPFLPFITLALKPFRTLNS